jgi:hypothetical protein
LASPSVSSRGPSNCNRARLGPLRYTDELCESRRLPGRPSKRPSLWVAFHCHTTASAYTPRCAVLGDRHPNAEALGTNLEGWISPACRPRPCGGASHEGRDACGRADRVRCRNSSPAALRRTRHARRSDGRPSPCCGPAHPRLLKHSLLRARPGSHDPPAILPPNRGRLG